MKRRKDEYTVTRQDRKRRNDIDVAGAPAREPPTLLHVTVGDITDNDTLSFAIPLSEICVTLDLVSGQSVG